jgi:hypothetical protein
MTVDFSTRPWQLRQGKEKTKMSVLLDSVRVASPCPASWEKMSGDDRIRHCQECKLNVYNLSDMTRAEAEHLIASREGRLCVRFFRRADGTILTRDCPQGLRMMIRRVTRVAGTALSAMMAIGTVFAQSAPQGNSPPATGRTAPKRSELAVIVVDPSGAVVSGAKIRFKDKKGKVYEATTKAEGVGTVSGLVPGDFALRVERRGFKTYRSQITISQDHTQPIRIALAIDSSITVTVGIIVESAVEDRDGSSRQTTFSGDLLRSLPMR